MITLIFQQFQSIIFLFKVGAFDTQEVSYLANGVEKSRVVVDPSSFQYILDEQDDPKLQPVALFEGGGGTGFFNFAFEGLVSGSKWGSAIGVIMFMLAIIATVAWVAWVAWIVCCIKLSGRGGTLFRLQLMCSGQVKLDRSLCSIRLI
ncbi:protein of unknown function, might be C4-dicarboxylate anaerobic carrier [Shewanella benthica]|uniref:Uncharacterized protein n=1 Tax=Shewanella benthica TaxID=43661 RepID=A0A330M5C8_9GAMM|nr:protein of unknown function, might be C4-dicarboxylate anaerobic carrier [Shewanella benthica]